MMNFAKNYLLRSAVKPGLLCNASLSYGFDSYDGSGDGYGGSNLASELITAGTSLANTAILSNASPTSAAILTGQSISTPGLTTGFPTTASAGISVFGLVALVVVAAVLYFAVRR